MMLFNNYLIVSMLLISLETTVDSANRRSFVVDKTKNCFLKDGTCYKYVSGSVHYFRIPHEYWRDRLSRLRAAGFDAVETYVMWNYHERKPGEYTFDGNADVIEFIQTAQDLGLLVILRPGPYIDNDVDFGGLPWWLLKTPHIRIRTADKNFMFYTKRWLDVLLPKIRPYTYRNGGPVISMQVENEYGSFGCDHNYTAELGAAFSKHLGDQLILFTTDGSYSERMVKCGHIDGIFTTVDFGPSSATDIEKAFQLQMKYSKGGPKVCSEFYPGWEDQWGHPHHTTPIPNVTSSIETIWSLNGSVNMFMFEGGTNFAYWAGSEGGGRTFSPITTSYDYDAPLSEAGDIRPKYTALRRLMARLKGAPIPYPVPENNTAMAYPRVSLQRVGDLFSLLPQLSPGWVKASYPLSFEDLNTSSGYVLYLNRIKATGLGLYFPDDAVHDRAYLFSNGAPIQDRVPILERPEGYFRSVSFKKGDTLGILVENQGRIATTGTGKWEDYRAGLVKNVTFNGPFTGKVLKDWLMYPLDLDKYAQQANFVPMALYPHSTMQYQNYMPTVFVGEINVTKIADTYIDPSGWGKGFIFINGHNLGRYWPSKGPQVTLYVPKHYLTVPTSKIVVFETENAPSESQMKFSKTFIYKN